LGRRQPPSIGATSTPELQLQLVCPTSDGASAPIDPGHAICRKFTPNRPVFTLKHRAAPVRTCPCLVEPPRRFHPTGATVNRPHRPAPHKRL